MILIKTSSRILTAFLKSPATIPEGIKLLTVDRGIFPEDSVRLQHPLPKPSALESPVDLRRVRAFCITTLELAASQGHALLPKANVLEAIASLPIRPGCPVTGDMLSARAKDMAPEIVSVAMDQALALQLARYQTIGNLVRKQVNGRIGQRLAVTADWATLLAQKFLASADAEEARARLEKAAALKELAEARFSVLVGPAGAGKTTVLGILCDQPEFVTKDCSCWLPRAKPAYACSNWPVGMGPRH